MLCFEGKETTCYTFCSIEPSEKRKKSTREFVPCTEWSPVDQEGEKTIM